MLTKFKKHEELLINKQLKIRLNKKEHEELKQFCYEKREMTMNDFVRELIKNELKRRKK